MITQPCSLAKATGNILCKLGLHSLMNTGHWCDPLCTIVLQEFECKRCGIEAWKLVHFDADETKVLKRIPADTAPMDAAILAECGKAECELSKKNQKSSKLQQKATGAGRLTESKEATKKRSVRKPKAEA